MTNAQPTLIIVMGVSGCGKSTIAKALAEIYDYKFMEADDFHSDAARAHMAAGKPLTDDMRAPWIARMCDHLQEQHNKGISSVLSYSGLRKAHREKFRALPLKVIFIFLEGEKALIHHRMQARSDHFMPSSLLDSQFEALEMPDNESDIFPINIDASIDDILKRARDTIETASHNH